MMAAVIAEGVAILLLAILVGGLLRSHADILRTLHDLGAAPADATDAGAGVPTVRRAPQPVTIDPSPALPRQVPASIVGTTPDGESAAVPLAGGRDDALLAFLSSGCATCQTFWDTFAAGRLSVPGGARLVIVTQDAEWESESALRSLQPPGVPVILSSETWEAFEVPGSPYFAYVDTDGHVLGEGTGAGWSQVVSLVSQAQADRPPGGSRRTDSGARRGTRGRRHLDDEALRQAGIEPGDPRLYPDEREIS